MQISKSLILAHDTKVTDLHSAYSSGYRSKPLREQIQMLAEAFRLNPQNAYRHIEHLPQLPEQATGWFAIVRWEAISQSYGEALENVLARIAKQRPFKNYRKDALSQDHLRVSTRTQGFLDTLDKEQPGDILLIPAQLGTRHQEKPVRLAITSFTENEFGLTAFAAGCIALTHPERFQQASDLDITCSGDEYAPYGDGNFSESLFYYFHDDRLKFQTRWLNVSYTGFGPASAFLPAQ